MIVIGNPLNALGTLESSSLRLPSDTIRYATVKPAPVPKPKPTNCAKFSACAEESMMEPNMAQLKNATYTDLM